MKHMREAMNSHADQESHLGKGSGGLWLREKVGSSVPLELNFIPALEAAILSWSQSLWFGWQDCPPPQTLPPWTGFPAELCRCASRAQPSH